MSLASDIKYFPRFKRSFSLMGFAIFLWRCIISRVVKAGRGGGDDRILKVNVVQREKKVTCRETGKACT